MSLSPYDRSDIGARGAGRMRIPDRAVFFAISRSRPKAARPRAGLSVGGPRSLENVRRPFDLCGSTFFFVRRKHCHQDRRRSGDIERREAIS